MTRVAVLVLALAATGCDLFGPPPVGSIEGRVTVCAWPVSNFASMRRGTSRSKRTAPPQNR